MNIISIDARMINNSGIGVYLKNLVVSLTGRYKLVLLGNQPDIKKAFPGIEFKVVSAVSPIYSLTEQAELPIIVPSSHILISPHYNIPLLPVRAKKRMVFIHDVNHLAHYESLNLKEKIYSRYMINRAIKKSDCVVTVSEFSKSEILKYTSASADQIKVLYFGINTEKDFSEDTDVKKKYKLPDNYYLFVGNVKPHKNLTGLLEAFKLLLVKNKEYKLVVAGKKEGFIKGDNQVFSFIEKNPQLKKSVIFTGYVDNDELSGIYKSASALVFPSFYEGFGIPPLEAMLAGCPVIASNAASIPEVCGDAALYVTPSSPEDIAAKIEMLHDNNELREKLIEKGKQRLKRFTLNKFSSNLHEIIRTLN